MIVGYTLGHQLGTFRILWRPEGSWALVLNEEVLGVYTNPRAALQQLIRGRCSNPSIGDPLLLGISDDLSEWLPITTARQSRKATG